MTIPPRYRHILKKGNFITPLANPIFQKENGGFDCYFKTAVRLLYYVRRIVILPPQQRFFYLPL